MDARTGVQNKQRSLEVSGLKTRIPEFSEGIRDIKFADNSNPGEGGLESDATIVNGCEVMGQQGQELGHGKLASYHESQ